MTHMSVLDRSRPMPVRVPGSADDGVARPRRECARPAQVVQLVVHALQPDELFRCDLAVDKQTVVHGLFADQISVSGSLLPVSPYAVNLPPSEFNPDQARQLLDQAGWARAARPGLSCVPPDLIFHLVNPIDSIGARLKFSCNTRLENNQLQILAMLGQVLHRIKQVAITRR